MYRRPSLLLAVLIGLVFIAPSSARAIPPKPILVSTPTSTRAIALDAVNFSPEPFSAKSRGYLYGLEQSTRIMLFALNVSSQPNDDISMFTADAEDQSHHHYNLTVEYAGKVNGEDWLTGIVVKLDQSMGDAGDVLLQIAFQGVKSNRVRIGIGHIGGGPADDAEAAPTPAPPYQLTGTISQNGIGFGGVSVSLSGSSQLSTTTDTAGVYSFTIVSVGDYSILPSKKFFTFTPGNILFPAFSGSKVINFIATRDSFAINGLIKDDQGKAIAGVSVALDSNSGGPTGIFATSGNDGTFLFKDVPAGYDYKVTARDTNLYRFTTQNINQLATNVALEFDGVRFYTIKGQVRDGNGKSLFGIRMSLTGPESATTTTGSDGSYSFTVTTAGDYVLTPSRSQDFYQFTPQAQSLLNLNDHHIVNFTGIVVITSPTYVLEFDGTQMSVDHNVYWPHDTNIGHFFWEFWAMPGNDDYARYILSDGYGGAHVLLFGFNYPLYNGQGSHYTLLGNIWNGSQPFYFNSDDGPSPGEWGYYAVGWDGKNIITYYDGVPVGKVAFTGPRVSTGFYNGSTLLMIGGSNHQNFIGRIAQVRAYEENDPHEGSAESSFAPQTIFSPDGQLLSYYFRPTTNVADLSNGYNGALHDGWPRGMQAFYFDGCDCGARPRFVLDSTAPDFSNPDNPGHAKTVIDNPASPPSGARVFDSFSRDNSTYILNGKGGLGATESSSALWQTNIDSSLVQPFGILSGKAVVLTDQPALAWVATGTNAGNLDVRVSRFPAPFHSGTNTGLAFRVLDKNNFFFAYSSDNDANPSGPKKMTIGYYQAGAQTILVNGIVMPSDSWTVLRVVTTTSGSISIYADALLIYSGNNSFVANATGAGLFNFGPGMGLQNRWDNFTVFDAQ